MLSISFLYEKLFFIAESFSFSVIAMVCLPANHEWSQYLNSTGIGVLKFSLFLCLLLSCSFFPKGSRIWWSLHKVCSVLSVHIVQCVYIVVVTALACACSSLQHPSLWLVLSSWHCMIIVLLLNYVISFCNTAVNCQVRNAVFFQGWLSRDVIARYILSHLLDCCSTNWPIMYNHRFALHIT